MYTCTCTLHHIQTLTYKGTYLWYQADVNVGKVGITSPKLKLSESLDKRHPLNVTNGTSKLGEMLSKSTIHISLFPLSLSLPPSPTYLHCHTATHPPTPSHTYTYIYLNNTDVWSLLILGHWDLSYSLHPLLNGISDMWNHCIKHGGMCQTAHRINRYCYETIATIHATPQAQPPSHNRLFVDRE